MNEQDSTQDKSRQRRRRRRVLLAIGVAVLIATACFILVAVLPSAKVPLLKDPLRSFLTGMGLLGVACPPYIIGYIIGKRAAASPYFEEAFIKTVLEIIGAVCLVVGVVCIGFSIYNLAVRFLGSG